MVIGNASATFIKSQPAIVKIPPLTYVQIAKRHISLNCRCTSDDERNVPQADGLNDDFYVRCESGLSSEQLSGVSVIWSTPLTSTSVG